MGSDLLPWDFSLLPAPVAVVRKMSCCDWLGLDHTLFLQVSGGVISMRSTRTESGQSSSEQSQVAAARRMGMDAG